MFSNPLRYPIFRHTRKKTTWYIKPSDLEWSLIRPNFFVNASSDPLFCAKAEIGKTDLVSFLPKKSKRKVKSYRNSGEFDPFNLLGRLP